MSKERELLKKWLIECMWRAVNTSLLEETKELLAQPEQEPKFNFDLERMKAAIESPISDVTVDDLAKQVKQEPVAWKVIDGRTNEEYMFSTVKPMERVYKYHVVIPLYAAPQTREPLSDKEITKNTPKLIHIGERLAFHAGVRFAERHHGIGVDDE